MKLISQDNIVFLVLIIVGIYVALQIYIIHKLKIIIAKLFEILFHFEGIMRRFKIPVKSKQEKSKKCCQLCKYRLAYYNRNSKIPGFFYYRCQITKKKVPQDFLCNDFVFDSQTHNV